MSDYIDHVTIDSTTKYIKEHRPQYELIREETFTNATAADYTIATDSNGLGFDLTDLVIQFETPTQENVSSMGSYGQIWFYYTDNSYIATENGSWTQEANAASHGTGSIIKQEDGMVFIIGFYNTTDSNNNNLRVRYTQGFGSSTGIRYDSTFSVKKIVIKTVTGTGHYRLYGKRRSTLAP